MLLLQSSIAATKQINTRITTKKLQPTNLKVDIYLLNANKHIINNYLIFAKK